jgi:phenylalanyl-tRNA synthetase alpha chain
MQELSNILTEAQQKIAETRDIQTLEQVRVHYLGKKGLLTDMLKSIGKLSPEERPQAGEKINEVKVIISDLMTKRRDILQQQEIQTKLNKEAVDITLPGRRQMIGTIHPITQTTQRLIKFFSQLGYQIAEGPELENDHYNFEALNIPKSHPARTMHDTFYFSDGNLLRTHTSTVQIRLMENQKPPLKMIAPGRVYRYESDVTHTPMFHQLEGLVIDQESTFADLKGLLKAMLEFFFEQDLKMRFRPSYFPFTEPSAEVDIQCVKCNGLGCRICKHTGWLEILGCGMVHPNVLKNVGLDPETYQGFAFGMGIDRLTMLRYGIDDLRILFENDVRFLKQF